MKAIPGLNRKATPDPAVASRLEKMKTAILAVFWMIPWEYGYGLNNLSNAPVLRPAVCR